ncbi:tyrosine-type recombinase/integrase [Nocardia sp. NPDC057353]|uniref:tyrosine-type recombinase/integrase n=1 Tax=Nocardia sp. NPDC057353 TaxID=3346104 RepID=UPI00363FFCC7
MTPHDLDMARALLERMGVDPADLLNHSKTDLDVPTFADYIPRIAQAVTPGTRRTYLSYWQRLTTTWPDRRLNEPSVLELQTLVEATRQTALARRNSRDGRSAAENMVSALRCLYRFAVNDGHVSPHRDPSVHLTKPRRLPSTRRALSSTQLEQVFDAATNTGSDDQELDILILRLHLETACRTSSALAIRPCDLDPAESMIRLHGKGGTLHWQPVSPTLMTMLAAQISRCGDEYDQLLRYRNGRAITRRRHDHIWNRIRQDLPWAATATQQISTHWLRHTTLTWVERHFGYAIARAFGAHAEPSGRDSTTLTYVRATIHEVAAAVAVLAGEPHPLVPDFSRKDVCALLPGSSWIPHRRT